MENELTTVNNTSFKIILNKDFYKPEDLLSDKYVIGCDPYKEEEPLNFWHKILAKLNMKHKTKYIGWSYTVFKLSQIEGKEIYEHINRKDGK